ncbi:MAG: CobD/CbiB family protein [Burkholderiales bacterium]|nr:CobD/CbiB family protein [Burkholderiales bacterium]
MSLIALVCALLLQKFRPLGEPDPLNGWLNRLADWVKGYANAGERRYGVLAWFAVALIVFVPLTLLYYLMYSAAALLSWLVAIVVLYLAIRLRAVLVELALIERALRRDDVEEARERLTKWVGHSALQLDRPQIAAAAIQYAVLHCYRGLFGVLFWFLVLPGPAGAVVYRAAQVLAERWRHSGETEDYAFGWFAGRMLDILDWLPQRLVAISFAIVGDFEDALYCWRTQAQTCASEGVVLASAAGALGVRLGESLGPPLGDCPPIGLGEAADENHLQSTEGLIWRAIVLWMVMLLLLALVQILSW